MTVKREQTQSQIRLLFEWLTKRGPGTILLRVVTQIVRIVTGHPVYRYSKITPNLYVGGQHRVHGLPSMEAEGITATINLRREFDDLAAGVAMPHHLYLPTRDNTPLSLEHLRDGVAFIEQEVANGGKVYIHCGVGVGRAPTLAAAYLVSTGLTPREAWRQIRDIRPFIWPMPGQYRQVQRFAEEFVKAE
ncbi:MAG: hypothetical protein OHK0046_34550 [Anaerolineae bacterium]